MFGAFAFVGADLHLRFGLSYTMVWPSWWASDWAA